jgi:hypothetical protein
MEFSRRCSAEFVYGFGAYLRIRRPRTRPGNRAKATAWIASGATLEPLDLSRVGDDGRGVRIGTGYEVVPHAPSRKPFGALPCIL